MVAASPPQSPPNGSCSSPAAAASPSTDGEVGPDAVALFRRRHGGLIWRVGVDLRVGPVTTATAALYFQRFFLAEKEGDFDAQRVAMACMWLASKVREEPLRLRDIVNAFAGIKGRVQEVKEMKMEAYWALRDEVVLHEQVVLRTMAFDVEPTPAYMLLLEISWLAGCERGERGVVALAWSLLNDAFCSDVCAVAAPMRMATACLLLAVELGKKTPELRKEAERTASCIESLCREPGLEAFLGMGHSSGGDEVEEIVRDLLALYELDREHGLARQPDPEDF
mmetsp:Transcript_88394/g.250520  ORF Transcript_88394/g.250520 Transcript_88394/m.250520 type:complete len:281 (-) Transcript_88394:228-1070(-)